MSDQGRWWKFYTTAPTDPHLQLLDRGDRWSWAALGAYIKVHGERGVLKSPIDNPILAAFLGVPQNAMVETLERIASVCKNIVLDVRVDVPVDVPVDVVENRHGEIIVTWLKWVSFQEDTTMAKRQQASRTKKRREEKRREVPPISPTGGLQADFVLFWSHYPRHTHRQAAERAWVKLSPNADLQATMIQAIDRQKATLTAWQDMERVPHAATWINGRRWEDEIPSNGNGTKSKDLFSQLESHSRAQNEADHPW